MYIGIAFAAPKLNLQVTFLGPGEAIQGRIISATVVGESAPTRSHLEQASVTASNRTFSLYFQLEQLCHARYNAEPMSGFRNHRFGDEAPNVRDDSISAPVPETNLPPERQLWFVFDLRSSYALVIGNAPVAVLAASEIP